MLPAGLGDVTAFGRSRPTPAHPVIRPGGALPNRRMARRLFFAESNRNIRIDDFA
jgi:hypothetical protein